MDFLAFFLSGIVRAGYGLAINKAKGKGNGQFDWTKALIAISASILSAFGVNTILGINLSNPETQDIIVKLAGSAFGAEVIGKLIGLFVKSKPK